MKNGISNDGGTVNLKVDPGNKLCSMYPPVQCHYFLLVDLLLLYSTVFRTDTGILDPLSAACVIIPSVR